MLNGDVRVVQDIATEFIKTVTSAITGADRVTLALSGGSSAKICYPRLANAQLPILWPMITLIQADERFAPWTDERSNGKLIDECFMNRLPELQPTFIRFDSQMGVERYDMLISRYLPIDIVHLGVGPDGHIASLFPNSPGLEVVDHNVCVNEDPQGINSLPRMTLTLPAINNARHVVITAFGESKSEVIGRLARNELLPANMVTNANTTWIIDPAAAAELT